jgi:hypothetical protein
LHHDLEPALLKKKTVNQDLAEALGGIILTTASPLALYQTLSQTTHLPEFAHLAYTHQLYAGPILFVPTPHSGLFTFPAPLLSTKTQFRSPSLSQIDLIKTVSLLLKQGVSLQKGDLITLINYDQTTRPSSDFYTRTRSLIKQKLAKEYSRFEPRYPGQVLSVNGGVLLGQQRIRLITPSSL